MSGRRPGRYAPCTYGRFPVAGAGAPAWPGAAEHAQVARRAARRRDPRLRAVAHDGAPGRRVAAVRRRRARADARPLVAPARARLEPARRGETLFVVAEASAPVPLLERVNDARKTGATILALDSDDPELDALAHEALSVPETLSFDAGQHLVSAAAGERASAPGGRGI